jgi:hypothetical protein
MRIAFDPLGIREHGAEFWSRRKTHVVLPDGLERRVFLIQNFPHARKRAGRSAELVEVSDHEFQLYMLFQA